MTKPPASPPVAAHRFLAAGRRLKGEAPWLILLVIAALLVLFPLLPLTWRAFDDGAAGIRALFDDPKSLDVYLTTLRLAVGATVTALILGTLLALSIDAMAPRARKYLGFIPLIPMMIPAVAHVIGFVFLFSPENGYVNTLLRATPFFPGTTGPINVYTEFWIIMYTGLNLASFVYLFVYTGVRNLGDDYGLAARVSGAGSGRVLWNITLPMLRPSFLYATVVVFMLSLGQFTGPLMLGRREGLDVVTTRMFQLTQEFPIDYALASALGTPLLVVAIFLVFLQRRLLGNQNRFVGRGEMSTQVRPRSSGLVQWASGIFTIAFFVLSALLPLLALLFVAISPYWSGAIDFSTVTMQNLQAVMRDTLVVNSIATSLIVTFFAIVIVIPLGTLIALGLYRRDRMWRWLAGSLDVLSNLPLSMPAALLGFGFLFAFSLPWIGLVGTRWALIIAYVAIMIPYSVRYQMTALTSLGASTTEASSVSGASGWRTMLQVIIPLTKRNIAASCAIIFVMLSHEFGVSVLLRKGAETTVMSVMLFEKFNTGLYPQVAAAALVVTVITAVGVVLAMMVGGRKAMEGL